jgi:hypothetical protein
LKGTGFNKEHEVVQIAGGLAKNRLRNRRRTKKGDGPKRDHGLANNRLRSRRRTKKATAPKETSSNARNHHAL